jgi:hypothetical protein
LFLPPLLLLLQDICRRVEAAARHSTAQANCCRSSLFLPPLLLLQQPGLHRRVEAAARHSTAQAHCCRWSLLLLLLLSLPQPGLLLRVEAAAVDNVPFSQPHQPMVPACSSKSSSSSSTRALVQANTFVGCPAQQSFAVGAMQQLDRWHRTLVHEHAPT